VTSVAWDPVRRYIFAGMENGKTIIYYASPGFAELTVVVELAHHTKKVAKMAYVQAHGDDLLVSIGRDSLLVVYSLRSERITSQANMLEGWLACLQVRAFHPAQTFRAKQCKAKAKQSKACNPK